MYPEAVFRLELMPWQHLDGKSMIPLLMGEEVAEERPLFWHYPHYSNQGGKPGAAIRLGDLKLIEFFEDNAVELYNLKSDPGETTDLSSLRPETVSEMLKLLHSWQAEVNAEGMDPNPDWDPNYLRENYLD